MRIAVDASWACGERTGTGVLTLNLVRALLNAESRHHWILYFRPCCPKANPLFGEQKPRTTLRIVGGPGTVFRSWVRLGFAARHDHVDVFLSPAFFLPLFGVPRRILGILDTNLYTAPRTWWRPGRRLDFLVMRAVIPLSLRRADHIVALSHTVAEDLSRRFPAAADRISVIPPVWDPDRLRGPPRSDARSVWPRPYFLYVGVMSPGKNLERLIEAYERWRRVYGDHADLVLIGRDCGRYRQRVLEPLVRDRGLAERVIFRGFVPDPELAMWYGGALAVVFPSLTEGFGYPIVEGMAAGVPVVTSRVGACAETGADAAWLVNPTDVTAIAEGMERIRVDADLRRRLITAGACRIRDFAPARIAQAYLARIEQMGSGRPA